MAAHQAPLSLGFSRQDHWSGLPFPSPMHESEKWKWSHSVVSDSSRPHGLQPTRLFCLSLHNYMSKFPKTSLSLSLSIHPSLHILYLVFYCLIGYTSLKNCNQNSAKLKEQVLRLIKFLYFIQGRKGNILAVLILSVIILSMIPQFQTFIMLMTTEILCWRCTVY